MSTHVLVPKGCYRIKPACSAKAKKPARKASKVFLAASSHCKRQMGSLQGKKGAAAKAGIKTRAKCIKNFFAAKKAVSQYKVKRITRKTK